MNKFEESLQKELKKHFEIVICTYGNFLPDFICSYKDKIVFIEAKMKAFAGFSLRLYKRKQNYQAKNLGYLKGYLFIQENSEKYIIFQGYIKEEIDGPKPEFKLIGKFGSKRGGINAIINNTLSKNRKRL